MWAQMCCDPYSTLLKLVFWQDSRWFISATFITMGMSESCFSTRWYSLVCQSVVISLGVFFGFFTFFICVNTATQYTFPAHQSKQRSVCDSEILLHENELYYNSEGFSKTLCTCSAVISFKLMERAVLVWICWGRKVWTGSYHLLASVRF